MKNSEMTTLSLAILRIINAHVGSTYAIKRGDLQHQLRLWGFGGNMINQTFDRRIREAIAYLRESDPEGAYICSDNAGSGYWRAESLEELSKYLETEKGRGIAILEKVSAQSKRAGVILKGQASYG